ncbi:MAG: nitroreductase family protein [Eubacteriaceae bacterium]|nr:nitroreductase family protein [Eubacteriaceae bacterium]
MNEIFERRSIRSYTGQKVSPEDMLKLAKAAMNAANGRGTKPWQIVIINDEELIARLVEYNRGWMPLKNAGCGMLLCGDTDKNPDPYYLDIDIAASTQNVLLYAHSIGLGTCWLGVAPVSERVEKVKELFNLPANFHPVSMCSVGYAAEAAEPNDRFLEDRIHYNSF